MPRHDYMDAQPHINAKMRAILIDWLVDVLESFFFLKTHHCRPETLHLSVNLIDRFLTVAPVTQSRLQLVGVTAAWIASKVWELQAPLLELNVLTDMCAHAYTQQDILAMESIMLTSLSFNIVVPTAANFFEILQDANGCDARERELVQYFLELGLLSIEMLQFTPSHMAAAALLLNNKLTRCGRSQHWPAVMILQSGYTEKSLKIAAKKLCMLLEESDNSPLVAARRKFSRMRRHAVSRINFMDRLQLHQRGIRTCRCGRNCGL